MRPGNFRLPSFKKNLIFERSGSKKPQQTMQSAYPAVPWVRTGNAEEHYTPPSDNLSRRLSPSTGKALLERNNIIVSIRITRIYREYVVLLLLPAGRP
jgi:hypothetical protein